MRIGTPAHIRLKAIAELMYRGYPGSKEQAEALLEHGAVFVINSNRAPSEYVFAVSPGLAEITRTMNNTNGGPGA